MKTFLRRLNNLTTGEYKQRLIIQRDEIREYSDLAKQICPKGYEFFKEKPNKFYKIAPEGYFRSKRTYRLVLDTPQNRAREALPYQSPEEKRKILKEQAELIYEEIKKMDVEERSLELMKFGLDKSGYWDPEYYFFNYPHVIISRIFETIKSTQKISCVPSYQDTERPVLEKSKTLAVPKARNKLEYVKKEDMVYPFSKEDYDKGLKDCKVSLYPHQIRIANFLRNNRGCVACFDVGTGKTLTAVVASKCILSSKIAKKVYVISPKSLVHNFEKELKMYEGGECGETTSSEVDSSDLTSSSGSQTPQKTELIEYQKKESIYNYFTYGIFANKIIPDDCKDAFVIIDEAHTLRTDITTQSQTAFKIVNCCMKASRVLLLTATPVVNSQTDILNLVAMVKGEPPMRMVYNEMSIKTFFKNIFSFHENQNKHLFPISRIHYHNFEMSKEYYTEYLNIQRSVKDDSSDPFAFLSGLRRAANDISDNPKINWILDFVKKCEDEDEKVVIYSAYKTSGLNIIKTHLETEEIPFYEINGEKTSNSRKKSVEAFNEDDEFKILLISQAGSLGLDLKGTRHVILLEPSWNKAQEDQVIGRATRLNSHIHLIKEKQFVDIHHLLLVKPPLEDLAGGDFVPSADSLLYSTIKKKTECIEEFLNILKSLDFSEEEFKPKKREEKKEDKTEKDDYSIFTDDRFFSPDPYKVLGIARTASKVEIREKFKGLCLLLHPDKNADKSPDIMKRYQEYFKKALDAYKRLY